MTNKTGFENLGLNIHLLNAIHEAGYLKPTPIQAETIPHILSGRDLVGCAQTGTGKTAAFALPILHLINKNAQKWKNSEKNQNTQKRKPIRVLILSPTRELAIQIGVFFTEYGKFIENLSNTVIFGGVKQTKQVKALKAGVDILVATPGRLLDLIGQGYIKLNKLEILVFDEADHMLDMGFIHDVRRIMKYVSKDHQTMLFSATMPKAIVKLADKFLKNPIRLSMTPNQPTVKVIDQTIYYVEKKAKQSLLNSLLQGKNIERALVFSRTKHGANKIVKKLMENGINAEPIHGNKSQNARQRALENFREGKTRVLVATDVAARGIDVDDITHVIQFDLPHVPETYVHRIGRTGRAGAEGRAIAFCDNEQQPLLKAIEKLIRMKIPVAKKSSSQNAGEQIKKPPTAQQKKSKPHPTRRNSQRRKATQHSREK